MDYDACMSPEHRVIIVVFNSAQLSNWLAGRSFFASSFAKSAGSGHSECMLLVKYTRYQEEAAVFTGKKLGVSANMNGIGIRLKCLQITALGQGRRVLHDSS